MTHINAYLGFNGHCREAMNFYQSCLSGELSVTTVADSPIADQMPPEAASGVLHAALTTDGFVLMGSDMAGPHLVMGNSIGLSVHCSSETEVHELFEKLAVGGEAVMPPAMQFWGAIFGQLIDKYGHTWMLSYDTNSA